MMVDLFVKVAGLSIENKQYWAYDLEQTEAVTTIDANVVVSAGAGSGKTKVLAGRYLYILASHPELEPKNILAITFTRKAAKEMQERIRQTILDLINAPQKFDDAIAQETKPVYAVLKQQNKEYWLKILEKLEEAQITTIDALCSRIVSEHLLEADVNIDFSCMENGNESLLYDKLKEFVNEQLAQKSSVASAIAELIDIYGFEGMAKIIVKLVEQREEVGSDFKQLIATYYANDLAAAKKEAEVELKAIDAFCKDALWQAPIGKLPKGLTKIPTEFKANSETLKNELAADDVIGFKVSQFPLPDKVSASLSAKFNDAGIDILKELEKYKMARSQLADIVKKINNYYITKFSCKAEYQDCFQAVYEAYLAEVDNCLTTSGKYTYGDLERKAIELLEQKNVYEEYAKLFQYVMVDEFQDTSESQRRLVYLLCGGSADTLEGNKLFVVGDSKQSIYLFRKADVRVFNRVAKDVYGDKEPLKLGTNYRSTPKILKAVEQTFKELMGEKPCEAPDPERIYFENLGAFKKDAQEQPLPALYVVAAEAETDVDEATADAVKSTGIFPGRRHEEQKADPRMVEAKFIAAKIKSLGRESYKNVAILLRSMNKLNLIKQALKSKEIPYQVVKGNGFYNKQEVLDIYSLFRVLDNHENSIGLATVLRAPFFGLNDDSITALCLNNYAENKYKGLWESLQDGKYGLVDTEQQKRRVLAAELLQELYSSAQNLSLDELWRLVFAKLQLKAYYALQQDGLQALANIELLQQQSLEFTQDNGLYLRDWLQKLGDDIKNNTKANEADVPAQETVQIMSIHQAKGLEFGTVIIPFIGDTLKASSSINFDKDMGLGLLEPKDGDKDNLARTKYCEAVHALLKQRMLEEHKRVLYVAMTRPSKQLILTGSANNVNKIVLASSTDNEVLVKLDSLVGSEVRKKIQDGKMALQDITLADIKAVWLAQLLYIFANTFKANNNALQVELITEQKIAQLLQVKAGEAEAVEQDYTQDEASLAIIEPLAGFGEAGRFIFSPSSLHSYLDCPKAYCFRYILQLPEGYPKKGGKTSGLKPTELGTLLHKALELIHWDEKKLEQAIVRTYFQKAVEEEDMAEEDSVELAAAENILQKYVASDVFKAMPDGKEREREFNFEVVHKSKTFLFTGIIDCMYERNGLTYIVDYKSNAQYSGAMPLGYQYQLAIYKKAVEAMAARQGKTIAWGGLALHYLRAAEANPAEIVKALDLSQADKLFNDALNMCVNIADTKEDDFCKTQNADRCDYCPFRDYCEYV